MTKAPTKKTPLAELIEEDAEIDSLLENPRNPRQHPEEQILRLMASLRARGQYKALLARQANRMLIAGHGVRVAALRLGWTTVRVAFWNVDQATADRAMLGDNRLGDLSTADDDRVSELLREIPETDWLSVGFSAEEAAKLLADLSGDELQVHEIETGDVSDTFWISVKGPLAMQAEALQRLKTLMGELAGVTIELGTIAAD